MALVGHPFPYNIENLLTGAVSLVWADPGETDVPDDFTDIFSPVAPYTLKTGWHWLGATKEAFSYSRNFETEGLEIQQSNSALLEEVTDITRTIQVSMAEFDPFGFSLFENAPSIETIAASAGKSAQKKVAFGSFTAPERYRWAWISRRPKASGKVVEPGGKERGRFVVGTAYQAQMAADEVEMEQGKGELTAAQISFTLFPETTDPQPEGEDVGAWLLEEAGTIAA